MNYTNMYSAIVKLLNESNATEYSYNSEMANAIQLWSRMYENKAPWIKGNVQSANLPSAIAYETAKLVTLELKSEVTGSATADFINGFYQIGVLDKLRKFTEYGLAKGSLIIKPIVDKKGVKTQFIQADRFFPVNFDASGNLTKCVLADQIRKGRYIYTLFEIHTLSGDILTVENRVFKSENDGILGSEVSSKEVEDWAKLPLKCVFRGAKHLPFGFFKCPMANQIDSDSPLGVSVYSRAVELIKEADKRYTNICWEFEATETAVHISTSMLKYDKDRDKWNYPAGKERLYREVEYSTGANDKPFIDTFSPPIREAELYSGWNNQLRMIEFACSLAYGTLSDPQNVDKTATEVNASKQRSYTFVADTQKALQTALEQWVEAVWFWSQIHHIVPNGEYKAEFEWGDSIISNPSEERKQDMQDLSLGILNPWEYRAKWYGEDEKTAKANLPQPAQVID